MESGTWMDMLDQPALPGHVYLHVPFCRSKCVYCDFASIEAPSSRLTIAVFRALEAEVRRWGVASLPGVVETVYVGGGTPSLYADQVARLLRRVSTELPLRDGAEITVEANPDSVDETSLARIAAAGANRISVGVQTFDDHVLRLLGRVHNAWQAREAIRIAQTHFPELSVDLMCGIPGQTLDSWLTTVAEVARTGVGHVSVYPLSVEEGTPLAALIAEGRVLRTRSRCGGRHDARGRGDLRARRSPALRGRELRPSGKRVAAQHGVLDWSSVRGHGSRGARHVTTATARAVGIIHDTDDTPIDLCARVRTWCSKSPEPWLAGEGFALEVLAAEDAAREDVMLGMRLARGVTVADVERTGLTSVFESLAGDGLVVLDGVGRSARWRTTTQGWLLGNEVFGRVWNAEDEGC